MKVVKRAVLRGLVPACTVAAVLGLSYLGPLPVDTSSAVGYAYNCGVKGNGYHDHGKVCPNRPFPGHGEGITEAVEGTQAEDNGTTSKVSGQVSPGSIKHKSAVSVTATVAPAVTESDNSTSAGNAQDI